MLELPDLRQLVPTGRADHRAQMILRIGYGQRIPFTPRRPLPEVIQSLDVA